MPKRFWRGKKRLAKKYMGGWSFNFWFKHGIPKIGDLTHDCDGFNHVITEVENVPYRPRPWWVTRKVDSAINEESYKDLRRQLKKTFIPDVNIFHSNGRLVCACNHAWQRPFTREEIESWALEWTKMKEQQIAGGWGWDPVCDTWADIINSGGHIVDEKGLLIVP
jgi:hypothetical protein